MRENDFELFRSSTIRTGFMCDFDATFCARSVVCVRRKRARALLNVSMK